MEKKDKAFTNMIIKRKKHAMVQLDVDTHKLLKEYCNHHGFKISGLLTAIIKQYIKGKK